MQCKASGLDGPPCGYSDVRRVGLGFAMLARLGPLRMPIRRPAPLSATELREIYSRWGKDRLARILLWEISRLRAAIRLLYRHVCRVTHYSHDSQPGLDADLEDALENEPVILEEDA